MPREKSSYHHGDLRRALLESARRLVEREGAREVSMRAIAREAGVSAAAPYHHFEDRGSLLAAVAASGFDALRGVMAKAAEGGPADGGLERLQAVGVAYVQFAVDNPEMFRLMFSGIVADRSRRPELQAASSAAWDVLRDALGSDGAGDRDEDLPWVGLATWSTVHGLAFLLIEELLEQERDDASTGEITRRVTRVLGRGLGAFLGRDRG